MRNITRMATTRKLDQQHERLVALEYLCSVNPEYIRRNWDVSEATVTNNIVGKRSYEWKDPLVEFYRQTDSWDRSRNAIHFYLAYNHQGEGIPNADLIDEKKDESVYEAVNLDIFSPRDTKVITETNLEDILKAVDEKEFASPEGKLLIDVMRDRFLFQELYYDKLSNFLNPILYENLRAAYGQDKKINLDHVYNNIKREIFAKLNKGLGLLQDVQVGNYARFIEFMRRKEINEQLGVIINTLTPREAITFKKRYGIGENAGTQDEVASFFGVTRRKIVQVESKAFRKLRDISSRYELLRLRSLVTGIVDDELIKAREKKEEGKFYNSLQTKIEENLINRISRHDPVLGERIKAIKANTLLQQTESTSIDELEISVRTYNCLKNRDIKTVGELAQMTEAEILKTKNFGKRSLNELRNLLQSMGLAFGMRQ